MGDQDKNMLDRAFPNEAELNLYQSTVKKLGRSEVLASNARFIEWFSAFIEATNNLSIRNMPVALKDAVQLLLCERTYLIQLIKGLIDRLKPKEHPKFFNDSFLENEFSKIKKKSPLRDQLQLPIDHLLLMDNTTAPSSQHDQASDQKQPRLQPDAFELQNDRLHPPPQQQQLPMGRRQVVQQREAGQNTVIEELLNGAGSFINNIGQKLLSPQNTRHRPQLSQHVYNAGGNGKHLIQTNQKYKQIERVQGEEYNTLRIVSQSDSSDDEVDITISSYESSESLNRKSMMIDMPAARISTRHSKPHKFNQRVSLLQESVVASRAKPMGKNYFQTSQGSHFQFNSPNTNLILKSASNNTNSFNSSQVSKINQRYERNLEEDDDLKQIFHTQKLESIAFNAEKPSPAVEKYLNKSENSRFVFEDNKSMQS